MRSGGRRSATGAGTASTIGPRTEGGRACPSGDQSRAVTAQPPEPCSWRSCSRSSASGGPGRRSRRGHPIRSQGEASPSRCSPPTTASGTPRPPRGTDGPAVWSPFATEGLTPHLLPVLVARLVTDGRLDPDSTVDRWFPTLPNAGRVTRADADRRDLGVAGRRHPSPPAGDRRGAGDDRRAVVGVDRRHRSCGSGHRRVSRPARALRPPAHRGSGDRSQPAGGPAGGGRRADRAAPDRVARRSGAPLG